MKLASVVGFEEYREIRRKGYDLIPGPTKRFLILEKAGKQLKVKVSEEAISFAIGV